MIIINFCYLPSPVQSDFVNTDAEGAIKSVRIKWVMLSKSKSTFYLSKILK